LRSVAIGIFLLLLNGRAQTISRLVLYRTAELEREKAALRSSEELLRKILDHASVGIAIHVLIAVFLRVNRAFARLPATRRGALSDALHGPDPPGRPQAG